MSGPAGSAGRATSYGTRSRNLTDYRTPGVKSAAEQRTSSCPAIASAVVLNSDESAFLDVVLSNPMVGEVLSRAATLALPDWYLTAGCLFQTVWNVLDGQPPQRGIRDYDLFYFDDSDLSWEAEDRVIRQTDAVLTDLPVEVEVRNEARVHLWYENKFGVPGPRFSSSADAIDHFAATACCLGLRRAADGSHSVYAPYGFADLLGFVLRPNPLLAPRRVYESKAQRWVELWPRLAVLPWPEPQGG